MPRFRLLFISRSPLGKHKVGSRVPLRRAARCALPREQNFARMLTMSDVSERVSGLEAGGKDLPILVKHYPRLGGKTLAFAEILGYVGHADHGRSPRERPGTALEVPWQSGCARIRTLDSSCVVAVSCIHYLLRGVESLSVNGLTPELNLVVGWKQRSQRKEDHNNNKDDGDVHCRKLSSGDGTLSYYR